MRTFLDEIVVRSTEEGDKLLPQLHKIINKYNFERKPECKQWLIEDKYVRYLGGYCKAYNVQIACEVGTMYGNSATGLSLGAKFVDTWDIDISNVVDTQIFADRHIMAIECSPTKCYEIQYNNYDVVFIDIGVHSGKEEQGVHEQLLRCGYKGIVFWDDINWGMRDFWESLTIDKMELDWHGNGGFGVTRYV